MTMVKFAGERPDTDAQRRNVAFPELEGMAKQQRRRRTASPKPALVLKVSGPDIRSGRIPVPELLVLCQHAQSAVNRQAEALEGRQTLRPGPKLGKVLHECTLELVSLGKGSAVLGFEQAKSQPTLPQMKTLGIDAIAMVGEAIFSREDGQRTRTSIRCSPTSTSTAISSLVDGWGPARYRRFLLPAESWRPSRRTVSPPRSAPALKTPAARRLPLGP